MGIHRALSVKTSSLSGRCSVWRHRVEGIGVSRPESRVASSFRIRGQGSASTLSTERRGIVEFMVEGSTFGTKSWTSFKAKPRRPGSGWRVPTQRAMRLRGRQNLGFARASRRKSTNRLPSCADGLPHNNRSEWTREGIWALTSRAAPRPRHSFEALCAKETRIERGVRCPRYEANRQLRRRVVSETNAIGAEE